MFIVIWNVIIIHNVLLQIAVTSNDRLENKTTNCNDKNKQLSGITCYQMQMILVEKGHKTYRSCKVKRVAKFDYIDGTF